MNLSRLSLGYKLTITLFLICVLLGMMFEYMTVRNSIGLNDDTAGVSITDVRYFFAGNPTKSVLQVMINGSMHKNFANFKEKDAVETWINEGASLETYDESIATILQNRCIQCHAPNGKRPDSPLTTYDEVQRYVTSADSGVREVTLAEMSVRYIAITTCLLALLCALFYQTRFSGSWKQIVMVFPFAGMLINVLSWWSAKQSLVFVHIIVASGLVAIVSVVLIILVILVDLWLLPEAEE